MTHPPSDAFIRELERLARTDMEAGFSVTPETGGMNDRERHALQLIDRIVANHQNSDEKTMSDGQGGAIRASGALEDIRDGWRIREKWRQQEKLLDALKEMDITLLSAGHEMFEDILGDSLKPIAAAAELNRIVIYKATVPGSNSAVEQTYGWTKTGDGGYELDGSMQALPDHPALRNWIEALSSSKLVHLQASRATREERQFLEPFALKSMLMVPIFTNEGIWGAIAFIDRVRECAFDDGNITFLSSAARLCANAIIRNDKTRNLVHALNELQRREQTMNALNKASLIFLSAQHGTFADTMTSGVETIARQVDFDHMSVFRNTMAPDGLRMTQIYRWVKADGGTTKNRSDLENIAYTELLPNWYALFRDGLPANGPARAMPDREKAVLAAFGIVSVYAVPLFIDQIFWGFVVFGDHRKERVFDDTTDMMRTAAFLSANAVVRACAEREAAERNEFNRMMFDASPVGLVMCDGDANIIDCNNRVLAMHEVAGKEDFIRHFAELSPAHQPDGAHSLTKAREIIRRSLNGEQIKTPWLHCTIKGDPIPCEVTLRSLKMGDNLYSLAYLYDLRDIKKLQDAVLYAEENTKLMFDAMPMSCALWNDQYDCIDCNQEIVRLLNLKDKMEYIRDPASFSPEFQPGGGDSIAMAAAMLQKAFAEGQVTTDWEHRLPDGASLPTEITLVRIRHETRDYVATYIRDMRETHRLIREEGISRAASEAKSLFLATMSHEIRTPMNSIIGLADLAMADPMPPHLHRYFDGIRRNSGQLLQIINDILDFSKIEAGQIAMERVPFVLRDVIGSCELMLGPKASAKRLALSFSAEGLLDLPLWGDPTKLGQAITNLLSNSIKFTKTGRIAFSAHAREMTGETASILFEVSDTGIGMTPDQTARIFEPFIQIHSGATRQYGGTGLGLSIARSIVTAMGGNLTVASAPDAGSVFSFALVFSRVHAAAPAAPETPTAPAAAELALNGEVLLCEDNNMNQEIALEYLSRMGLKATLAQNGLEAVEIARQRLEKGHMPFDLILMDIHMPEMDGLEAASKILGMGVRTPIVAMTANVMADDQARYREAGMADFLGKPFTKQQLTSCLSRFVPAAAHPREAPENQANRLAGSPESALWPPPPSANTANTANAATANADADASRRDTLIRRMERLFLQSSRATADDIRKAIEKEDAVLAHRLAHTLKTNALQIGQASLGQIAQSVESALKNGSFSEALELLPGLKIELQNVLDACAKRHEGLSAESAEAAAANAGARPMGMEEIKDWVARLLPLAESGNPGCLKFLPELRRMPGSETLIQQLQNFDFNQAADTLRKMRDAW